MTPLVRSSVCVGIGVVQLWALTQLSMLDSWSASGTICGCVLAYFLGQYLDKEEK